MKVFVYYNLHKKLWSIKAKEGPDKSRVIAHSETVYLTHCKMKVSSKGRHRVLKEKRKNVHAGIEGRLVSIKHSPAGIYLPEYLKTGQKIAYNPYKYETFVTIPQNEPIHESKSVFMSAVDKPVVTINNNFE